MCEFKKGDKVICINTDNHPELIKNKIYEVEKPNGDFVYLKGCKYGYFTFLFRKECEYCKNDGYYKANKSLISKKLKNNVDIDLSINVKDKKIVASIENLTMNIEDNNWVLPTKKINYCPMCRPKISRRWTKIGRKEGD